ncbi:glycoside hydrolase family 2 TIM barrel-domain containing protein [Luteimonas sp. M1R5S59]|uniref:Glycoside hydrolase family 2 TIM barrel-domain containing protein n=2 Tax=Luteimonas kalidii TaxID=3042025 RepID=A0ABT6JYH8_9GAMM|nr:glycoside hydrolase family 2 TIM barrel-domain containing protein [Luteimonas kalidii]MDH5835216.1 glycoside hydrolase family 2 TIM barrel-domain containing protein [Luteimonas kalidii]
MCVLATGTRAETPASTPAEVRIVEEGGAYRLLVDGQPYVVRGAGSASGDLEQLAARGGNSVRTWSTGTDVANVHAMLDRAHRNGLTVAMGLAVGKERHGFDYDDARAVAVQLDELREQVRLYRDHPAVLMWLVGNELNLEHRNPKVWDAVEQITRMIHAEDPNHPVMTPLAGFDRALIDTLKTRAPSLDLIGIQLYGDLETLPDKLREADWTGPYVVTEWGPTGHWESPLTAWGAPVEDDGSRKAALFQQRYRDVIAADTRQCLGSYVFLWGHKQERTPTWYGLFLPTGESTPAVDAMQRLWTGQWPDNRAPSIAPATIDGRGATDSVVLAAGTAHEASTTAHDPDGDALQWRWYALEESTATSIGGDPEAVPAEVDLHARPDAGGRIRFTAPGRPGHYRLFVEVRDGHGHAAYANLPFRVEEAR